MLVLYRASIRRKPLELGLVIHTIFSYYLARPFHFFITCNYVSRDINTCLMSAQDFFEVLWL